MRSNMVSRLQAEAGSGAVGTATPAPAPAAERPPLTSVPRRLRILFVVEQGTLLRFALLVPELAARGHEVHIAFAAGQNWLAPRKAKAKEPPARALRLAEDIRARFPQVSYSLCPQRSRSDGWQQVAWLVRGLADLAHNASPQFETAPGPRHRTKERILRPLERRGQFEPLARRLVLRAGNRLNAKTDAARSRRMIELCARLEDAIPSSARVERYIRDLAPDIVVATGTFRHVSDEVELLKSARRLGIPTGVFVASWDNLTNKGSMKFTPDRVYVWNDVQAREAVELHRIPRERVRTTGAHVFDQWFDRRPTREREEFLAQLGLDPDRPYVLYVCSSSSVVAGKELEFVRTWIDALRSSSDERLRRINIVVRPYPAAMSRDKQQKQKRELELGTEGVVVWPLQSIEPVIDDARADFFDTLAHSAAVVGINTTAMIEAAIVGKSVLTVLVPSFKQKSTVHFRYLVAENGGFVQAAESLDQHVEQLARVLDGDGQASPHSRRFVESFVRPHGVGQAAAPVAVAAIEELADVAPDTSTRRGTRVLRSALSLEAGMAKLHRSYRRLRRRARAHRAP